MRAALPQGIPLGLTLAPWEPPGGKGPRRRGGPLCPGGRSRRRGSGGTATYPPEQRRRGRSLRPHLPATPLGAPRADRPTRAPKRTGPAPRCACAGVHARRDMPPRAHGHDLGRTATALAHRPQDLRQRGSPAAEPRAALPPPPASAKVHPSIPQASFSCPSRRRHPPAACHGHLPGEDSSTRRDDVAHRAIVVHRGPRRVQSQACHHNTAGGHRPGTATSPPSWPFDHSIRNVSRAHAPQRSHNEPGPSAGYSTWPSGSSGRPWSNTQSASHRNPPSKTRTHVPAPPFHIRQTLCQRHRSH